MNLCGQEEDRIERRKRRREEEEGGGGGRSDISNPIQRNLCPKIVPMYTSSTINDYCNPRCACAPRVNK